MPGMRGYHKTERGVTMVRYLQAEQLGVNYTGTIGVIIKAKINGAIHSIKPILAKIKETDFRITADIERQALLAADEI
jgi:predicted nucleic acid-binding protein